MVWHIQAHNHWFCNEACVKTYEEQQWLSSQIDVKNDNKRIAYLLIAVILWGWFLSRKYWVMRQFMGWFFVIVAILKLIDVKGFATAYSKYDIISKQRYDWWHIYPFIELWLGIAFLSNRNIEIIAIITFVLMIIWTIWVAKKLVKKEKFRCACLWTKLNIPLTNLTLVEDILMGIMALMLLLWF